MKYLIASDLHGSEFYTSQLLKAFTREQADRLIFLGDILYHGPRNDLPQGYNPKAVIAMLNPMADRILCVRGNCEAEVDQMVLDFPVLADYALMEVNSHLLFLTHGHIFNEEHPPKLMPGDILLHGHTHIPVCHTFGAENQFLLMNPGSVSIPKAGSDHSYMTLEGTTFTCKRLEDGHELQVHTV